MNRLLIIPALVAGMVCEPVLADTLITGTFGSAITPAITSGYAFVFNRDVLVSSVGVYDSSGNGLLGTNTLGIWTSSGSLIASKVFDSTTSPTLTAHFRWLGLDAPLALSANIPYWIATFGPAQGLQGAVGSGTLSPDVTFIAEVGSGSGSFTFPNSATNRTSGSAYTGPNLQYTRIPKLQAAMSSSSHLLLSWPTNAPKYVLESASILPSAGWHNVTNTPAVVGNQFVVGIDATNSQGFYRLRFQP
jgi:hypothetical protein